MARLYCSYLLDLSVPLKFSNCTIIRHKNTSISYCVKVNNENYTQGLDDFVFRSHLYQYLPSSTHRLVLVPRLINGLKTN